MVDAVDSLLNNAVDLYVQAIDYRQIPTPVGAGIRRSMPKSGDIRQLSPDSGGIVPDSGQIGWNLAGSPAILPGDWPF
jgi:hypothetical protein